MQDIYRYMRLYGQPDVPEGTSALCEVFRNQPQQVRDRIEQQFRNAQGKRREDFESMTWPKF